MNFTDLKFDDIYINNKMSVSILPPEVLIQILRLLTTSDLLLNVSQVSQQFNGLVRHPGVHLNVVIGECVETDGAVKFVKEATLLKELRINQHKYLDRGTELRTKTILILSALDCHEHINAIHFERRLDADTFIALSRSKWWNKLEKFCINVLIEDHAKLVREIEKLNRLKKHNFNGLLLFNNLNHYQAIAKTNKETLEEIRIEGCHEWKSEDYYFLLEFRRLKVLTCSGGFNEYLIFPKLKNLTTLRLEDVRILDFSNGILPTNSLPLLIDLKIRFSYAGGEESTVMTFANACPNLQVIDMVSCQIVVFGIDSFQKIAQMCPKLKIFRLLTSLFFSRFERRTVIKWEITKDFHKFIQNLSYLQIEPIAIPENQAKSLFQSCPNLSALQNSEKLFVKFSTAASDVARYFEHRKFGPPKGFEIVD